MRARVSVCLVISQMCKTLPNLSLIQKHPRLKKSLVSITLSQKMRHTKTYAYTQLTLTNEDTRVKIDEKSEY